MALKKEAVQKLLKTLKFDDAKIEELLGEQEVDVDLPELHIYNENELNELKKNVQKNHEVWYTETQGKQLNDKYKLGLTSKDAKDPEKVLAAMKQKAIEEAGVKPDAQISELNEKIKTLQGNIDEKDRESLTWKEKYEMRLLDDEYRSLFLPERNDALDDTEWIERLKKHVGIKKNEDGVTVYIDKKTGKEFSDAKLNPLDIDAVKAKIWKNEGWTKAQQEPAEPKITHNPANTPNRGAKKYKDHDAIMAEVERKYPRGAQGVTNKVRMDYYTQLQTQSA